MKSTLIATSSILVFLLLGQSIFYRTLTVQVVDENSKPLSGIDVELIFEESSFHNPSWSSTHKFTNSNGEVTGVGSGDLVGYSISIPGYYHSTGISGDDKYMKAILKKIENPVAMYANNIRKLFPNDGLPHGYDLIKNDWLPPLGTGLTADLIFRVTGYVKRYNDRDQTLELTFSNPTDGIQAIEVIETGSELRLPKVAPLDGYKSLWTWHSKIQPDMVSTSQYLVPSKENRAYFLRIRSKRDDKGNLIGLYGKISHDLDFESAPLNMIRVQITSFYINPDGTQNVEFDRNKNLFSMKPGYSIAEP